jgi:TolA-binding protein
MGTVEVKNLSWGNVVAPVIVAIIVGIGASYVTTRVQITAIQTRVKRAEKDITRLRTKSETRRRAAQDLRERVIRMNAKIDLLLQSEGINTDDISQAQ